MATHTAYYTEATGGTYYAYPVSQSLTDWSTYRVQLVEGSGDNVGRYSGSLDDANGDEWHVFSGATQPSSWADSLAVATLGTAVNVASIDANAISASALATDAVTEIVAGVWNATLSTYSGTANSVAEKVSKIIEVGTQYRYTNQDDGGTPAGADDVTITVP